MGKREMVAMKWGISISRRKYGVTGLLCHTGYVFLSDKVIRLVTGTFADQYKF